MFASTTICFNSTHKTNCHSFKLITVIIPKWIWRRLANIISTNNYKSQVSLLGQLVAWCISDREDTAIMSLQQSCPTAEMKAMMTDDGIINMHNNYYYTGIHVHENALCMEKSVPMHVDNDAQPYWCLLHSSEPHAYWCLIALSHGCTALSQCAQDWAIILMYDASYWAKLSHIDAWCTTLSHIIWMMHSIWAILMHDAQPPYWCLTHSIEPQIDDAS